LGRGTRRSLAVAWVGSPAGRALRRAARRLGAPACAWVLFNVNLWLWHLPAAYDATLRAQALHDVEHLTFLVLGVVFWAQVIESPPLRPRLDMARRVGYVVAAAASSWLLAVVLAFAGSPLYPAYAALDARPGGLSALADQQIAAGIMWGPGSIPYAIFVFTALYAWLAPGDTAREARAARLNGHAPAAH
jgi:cytochrome c oxidase assembly factor CtaG